jgi:integrase
LVGLRDRLIRNRTQLSNAIRGYAAEFGFTAARGMAHIDPLLDRIQADESVPVLARELFAAHAEEYAQLQAQIAEVDAKLMAWHKADECSRRLANARAKTVTRGLRFSSAAEAYLAAQARDKDAAIRQSTLKLHKKVFELFADYSDDPPVDQVARKVASGFLHHIGTERKLSNRTLRQYSVCLAQVFKWARTAGHSGAENPFTGQTFRAPRDAGWQPYEGNELKVLFSDSMFDAPIKDALPWVMLIAVYSGLRLNEICQLRVADLHKEQGVRVIHVRGQLLKTPAAKRMVPLHSRLETAGLLEYARGLPADGWLFPSLKPQGPDGKRSLRLTKKFTDYRRRKGIDRPRLTFHSFRGNFASALDKASVPQSDISALLGHSRGFSLNVYSSGGPGLQRLRELVEKVNYGAALT